MSLNLFKAFYILKKYAFYLNFETSWYKFTLSICNYDPFLFMIYIFLPFLCFPSLVLSILLVFLFFVSADFWFWCVCLARWIPSRFLTDRSDGSLCGSQPVTTTRVWDEFRIMGLGRKTPGESAILTASYPGRVLWTWPPCWLSGGSPGWGICQVYLLLSRLCSQEGITTCRLHLRGGGLVYTSWRMEYLHKLFEILHGRFIYSPPFIYLLTYLFIHSFIIISVFVFF